MRLSVRPRRRHPWSARRDVGVAANPRRSCRHGAAGALCSPFGRLAALFRLRRW